MNFIVGQKILYNDMNTGTIVYIIVKIIEDCGIQFLLVVNVDPKSEKLNYDPDIGMYSEVLYSNSQYIMDVE